VTEPDEPTPPTSSDLHDIVHSALSRSLPGRTRLRLWLSRLKSRAATMGGYWGGVTFWDRWRKKP